MEFNEWVCEVLSRTEVALSVALPSVDIEPMQLHQAMRYAVLGGGKRVRPMLCHAAGQALDAPGQLRDTASCAIELIHVYSLVHDDLPLMDNDNIRHDKPAVHIQYDEVMGLLVGDALQSQAFIVLASDVIDVYRRTALMRILASATGSLGMAGGQAIDLASVGMQLSQTQLEMMHRMKTGALLRAAVKMGATCGDKMSAEIEAGLDAYAKAVGLAFQIVDDILDVTANSTLLGKTAGKDAANNKPTYVSVIGLQASLKLVAQLRCDAYTALAPLGERGIRLAQIADMVVKRVN
ncbi:polyprenyl synthetase family protein [Candidatus Vallotia lariciata]|uniref:polyprenyl synthetase family protein n=1 Tax=Candidatus Vallotia laricis TaxID=2018052 RepID=UPI001D003E85|nr:farnesyl diphosphate synthase [Candidatus Vallotia lariciata]